MKVHAAAIDASMTCAFVDAGSTGFSKAETVGISSNISVSSTGDQLINHKVLPPAPPTMDTVMKNANRVGAFFGKKS